MDKIIIEYIVQKNIHRNTNGLNKLSTHNIRKLEKDTKKIEKNKYYKDFSIVNIFSTYESNYSNRIYGYLFSKLFGINESNCVYNNAIDYMVRNDRQYILPFNVSIIDNFCLYLNSCQLDWDNSTKIYDFLIVSDYLLCDISLINAILPEVINIYDINCRLDSMISYYEYMEGVFGSKDSIPYKLVIDIPNLLSFDVRKPDFYVRNYLHGLFDHRESYTIKNIAEDDDFFRERVFEHIYKCCIEYFNNEFIKKFTKIINKNNKFIIKYIDPEINEMMYCVNYICNIPHDQREFLSIYDDTTANKLHSVLTEELKKLNIKY